MNRPDTITSGSQRKEAFLEKLANMQEELDHKGIDYRIIGSLASHAYLDTDTASVAPLSFDRPGAATLDQKVPDIDLIVPRADLPEMRAIRTKMLTGMQPVKIGLANPTTDIDFRPNDADSFLTHKDISLPVASNLLRTEDNVRLEGLPIRTIPLDTLIHTYGTFGGMVRRKDMPVLKALIRKSNGSSDPRTEVFHQFQKERQVLSPGEHLRSMAIEAFESKAPRRLRNELHRVALIAADMLGKR